MAQKIYTKTGDDGTTSLGKYRISKTESIIEVMGEFAAPQILTKGGQFRVFDPNTRTITDTGIVIPPSPQGTEFQQVGDELALIDKDTGVWIGRWKNVDRLSSGELRALSNDAFKQTTDLRKEFQGITEKAQEAINLADAALLGPEGNPASGQTLIIGINKILDPDSVVRQSEFERVNEIGGILAKLEAFRNQADRGQLSQRSEADIRSEIQRLRVIMAEEVSRQATFFVGLASQNGLNPDQVVRPSLVQNLANTPPVTPGAVVNRIDLSGVPTAAPNDNIFLGNR